MPPIQAVLRRLLLCLAFSLAGPRLAAGSVRFEFPIPDDATTTSAGVFAADGTLLRTLWSNETATPGRNEAIWDGLDDEGLPMTPGPYTIKVLHSRITHDWQGTIANTSVAQTGHTVRRSFEPLYDLAISGSDMVFAYGYNEGKALFARSLVGSPNEVAHNGRIESSRNFGYVATDGARMYFAQTGNALKSTWPSFVVAYEVADNSQVVFSAANAVIEAPGQYQWDNVIDRQQAGDGGFTGKQNAANGLAVQTAGRFLFVSHGAYNQIRVFDKTTGASVASAAPVITAPGRIAITRDDAGLWAIVTENSQRVVRRYAIDAAGNLSPGAVITGLANPLALAVSPDNATLLVADGGASQQVKAFANAASGSHSAPLWTLGQPGGYITNGTAITTDKFNFRRYDKNPNEDHPTSYLAFQDDGSFWVGDAGNERNLHFSADRAYLEEIMYLSHSYVMTVCVGDPTRVFAGWMEFSTDYSTPINRSWRYVRNWAAGQPESITDGGFAGFNTVVKLGERTFAVASERVCELQSTGVLRDTGIVFTNEVLHEDGSLRWADISSNPAKATYYKRAFASLNSSKNPTWGSTTILGTSPITGTNPRTNTGGRGGGGMRHPSTASGLTIFTDGGDARFHIGAIPAGGSALKWRSAPSGRYFDTHGTVGTLGHYPANNAYANGNHIVFAAHGEGATDIYSRTYQANQFLHFWHDGLQIGQFGSPLNYPTNALYPAAPWLPPGLYPGRAGNALSSAFVSVDDDLYYWHCDESQASGLHLWKINHHDSVEEKTVNVTLPAGSRGTGLTGQYFNGTNPETYTLVTQATDPAVDFDWGSDPADAGVNTDNFSVRWTGLVEPRFTQTYTFRVNKAAANRARLYIADTLVADGWASNATSVSGKIALEVGKKYQLRLEYRDASVGADASVSLQWQSSSQALQVIPHTQLFPSDVVAINFGGPAVGRFAADPLIVDEPGTGNQRFTTNAVATTGIADPAPQLALQDARQGALSNFGVITLAPSTQYRVRMHLAEIVNSPVYQGVGKRIFDFADPELGVIRSGIDIFALAGGGYKARVIENVLGTDNAGHLRISFENNPNFSLVNALEIFRDTSPDPVFAPLGAGNGLKADYYTGTAFNTLVATRVDPDVNFYWTSSERPPGIATNSNYTVRWTGQVLAPLPGEYRFRVEHDNGVRLWVNGTRIIDQWSTSGSHDGLITLAGSTRHDLKLEYLQTTSTAKVALRWIPPEGGSVADIIPRSQLYTDYTTTPPAPAPGRVLAHDDFATAGDSGSGWLGAWSGAFALAPGALDAGNGLLTFGGRAVGSSALHPNPNFEITRVLSAPAASGVVWVSWLQNTSPLADETAEVSFRNGATPAFSVGQHLDAATFKIYAPDSAGAVANSGVALTGTRFVVLRLNLATRAIDLWINPSGLDSGLSPVGSPAASLVAGGSLAFDSIRFASDADTFVMDELRVGSTWIDVSPTAGAIAGVTAFRTAYGLAANGAQDVAAPAGDGVANLLKYAFNLLGDDPGQTSDLAQPNTTILLPGGRSGLPRIDAESGTGKLRLTYIRRKAAGNPGTTYAVEFSDSLAADSWAVNPSASATATSLDAIFERVTVTDSLAAPSRRFARVKVTVD